MNDIVEYPDNDFTPAKINPADYPESADIVAIANSASDIVAHVANTINNLGQTARDIALISSQVEIETKRLDHALDCLLLKSQHDRQIYRDTIPLLEKNFSGMQSRMDRLMDRALDMLCEDVSDASLSRQEAVMKMIEITNESLNNLIAKLLPKY